MKVKLIQMTQNPIDVMWTAARTCYSAKSPIEMWEELGSRYSEFGVNETQDREAIDNVNEEISKHWNLVKKVLDSGHDSIAEHCYFTFCIEGVSRALLAQITRHRAGIVFSVMSQRYVEIKESKQELFEILDRYEGPEMKEFCDKYFVDFKGRIDSALIKELFNYLDAIEGGEKPEDARMYLPNATKTNITMSVNLRELMHMSNLRLCSRSQAEIRQLFQAIKKEVEQVDKRLGDLLVPSCVSNGCCKEIKPCYYYKKVLKDEK